MMSQLFSFVAYTVYVCIVLIPKWFKIWHRYTLYTPKECVIDGDLTMGIIIADFFIKKKKKEGRQVFFSNNVAFWLLLSNGGLLLFLVFHVVFWG